MKKTYQTPATATLVYVKESLLADISMNSGTKINNENQFLNNEKSGFGTGLWESDEE